MTLRQRIAAFILSIIWAVFDALVREEFDKITPPETNPDADVELTPDMESRITALVAEWTAPAP